MFVVFCSAGISTKTIQRLGEGRQGGEAGSGSKHKLGRGASTSCRSEDLLLCCQKKNKELRKGSLKKNTGNPKRLSGFCEVEVKKGRFNSRTLLPVRILIDNRDQSIQVSRRV